MSSVNPLVERSAHFTYWPQPRRRPSNLELHFRWRRSRCDTNSEFCGGSVKRPKLTPVDRCLWAWLSQVWNDWRSSLLIVQPETVIAWHRKSFRLFWTWKVQHGLPGCPRVSMEIRKLIRKMSRDNPLWGAPRIHGEPLKLGIDIGETSVGKYIARRRKPPSQTWRTFLENHVKTMVPFLPN